MILRSSKKQSWFNISIVWKSGYFLCWHLNFTAIIKSKQSYMMKRGMSLYGCCTLPILNGMNANTESVGRICRCNINTYGCKAKLSTWRLCTIVAYRRKNKCFQVFYYFIYLCAHPSVLSVSNWFLFLIQQPTLVLPNTSNDTSPTGEPEPFLYVLGRRKMQEAESKCYKRMQLLPPYQGEGKKKDYLSTCFKYHWRFIFFHG